MLSGPNIHIYNAMYLPLKYVPNSMYSVHITTGTLAFIRTHKKTDLSKVNVTATKEKYLHVDFFLPGKEWILETQWFRW